MARKMATWKSKDIGKLSDKMGSELAKASGWDKKVRRPRIFFSWDFSSTECDTCFEEWELSEGSFFFSVFPCTGTNDF